MTPDYHIHTPYCGHAQGRTVDYIEAAIKLGLTEIGFADHLGRYYLSRSQRKRHWDWGMDEQEVARYHSEIADLREVYEGRIVIRIGLEVDFVEGAEDLLAPVSKLYPFDFYLGSIHCIPKFGWQHLAKLENVDPVELFTEYFISARAAVESGLFQSLAHLDFVWRYVPWPESGGDAIHDQIVDVVQAARRADACIEINANGFVWSVMNGKPGVRDPFETLVEAIVREGVPISLGSDAHAPGNVGKSFPDLVEFLNAKGIRQVALFRNRQRTMVDLG
jgi:histidinol-phosphatase (PHP family)